ncbi:TrmB family transcriptional regulator [Candidatus Woesearchaeota archaeon]|nr:MAG: TrmB family transcriptional regulator [Candidatus Woesearchaeota archaeon]
MHEDVLMKAGLTLREVNVYTLLRTQGELMASEIAKKAGLIRTNVYDILESLIQKGIVSSVIRSGKKYFRATDPEKLVDYVNNQKRDLDEVSSDLIKILSSLKPVHADAKRPVIEVYEGKEGMKTILEMSIRESLKTKKEILGISVQQEKCRLLAGPYHVRWYKDREKFKIKSRYLMSAEENIIPVQYTQFKILPKEAKNPNELFIFGNITTQFFFTGTLFTAILINNEEITSKYRDYFSFLWKLIR